MTKEEEKLFDENDKPLTKEQIKAQRRDSKNKAKQIKYYQNYFIIAILSFLALVFLPMLGTDGDVEYQIPDTFAGFVIWLLSKVAVIILNLMIFGQFIKQAKINVRDHELYIEAERLLNLIGLNKKIKYYHPQVYIDKMKKEKRVTVLITSTLSIFGFTPALLQFDWVTFLSYLFTVVTCVMFGWITMLDTEDLWTYQYIKYARQEYDKWLEEQNKIETQESLENELYNSNGGSNGSKT